MRLRFLLFLLASLLCFAAHATTDTSRVRAFIESWKDILEPDEIQCMHLETCYADTVRFYNESYPKSWMCVKLTESIPSDAVLLETGYRTEPVAGSNRTWKVIFENAGNIYGTNKYHYMLVQEIENGKLVITAHSSLADDRWFARRKQIESDVISDQGKKYYVLDEDSTTFPGQRLYFLTDTLAFTVPDYHGLCNDSLLSYRTSGNVFVAMSRTGSRQLSCIQNISKELNEETFEEAQLLYGGFPCFAARDSTTPAGEFTSQWVVPKIQWMLVGNDTAHLRLRCDYNYGDACLRSYTSIHVLRRKKKIEVSKVMAPRPKGPPRH